MRTFSVIIAAHNEAAVIGHTLEAVLACGRHLGPGAELEVIVVANGCADDTAAIARSFAGVEVIETTVSNKVHALNLGDRAARHFPRAYLDADCAPSPGTLARVAEAFEGDAGARIVVPGVRHVYEGWNPLLAGYYRLWSALPYVRGDMMGRGFYAIDRALRSRFAEFPALTADDKFIRSLTEPHERRVADGCWTTVRMPARFRDLLRVKTRWTFGNLELAQRRPELLARDTEPHAGTLRFLATRPRHWPHVPTFLTVWAWSKLAARRKLRRLGEGWERDESTRLAGAAAS